MAQTPEGVAQTPEGVAQTPEGVAQTPDLADIFRLFSPSGAAFPGGPLKGPPGGGPRREAPRMQVCLSCGWPGPERSATWCAPPRSASREDFQRLARRRHALAAAPTFPVLMKKLVLYKLVVINIKQYISVLQQRRFNSMFHRYQVKLRSFATRKFHCGHEVTVSCNENNHVHNTF